MSASPGVSRSTSLASVRNPFSHEVVTSPWDRAEADAPQINAQAFDLCCRLIREVAATRRSNSLLMHGIAGSGKTHVMARLRTYLQSSQEGARTVFISVRMDAAPSRIWRHFRRHLVDDLLRSWKESFTRLQLILRDRLREHPAKRSFQELAAELHLNYSLAAVLAQYHEGTRQAECRAWLRGEALPEDVLRVLGVTEADGADEEQLEEHAHEIVVQLCRLAAPDLVVFCFDQLESMEAFPGDQKGLSAYAKLAAALVDELDHAFVISSIQSVFLERLSHATHAAHFDRLSRNRIDLQPLNWEQGKQLLQSRMAAVPELVAKRSGDLYNSLWPIDEAELKAEFKGDSCIARKVIHRAKELFEAARGNAVSMTLPETLAVRLAESLDKRRKSDSDPLASDDILLQGLPMLLDIAGRRAPSAPGDAKPPDIVARSVAGNVPVIVCNQENMVALGNQFKRILDAGKQRLQLLLVRDQRRSISGTAVKCREKLKQLEDRGARLAPVAPEVMAALDALRAMLGDANTGDLLYRGEPVAPASVREWLASNLPPALQDFLEDITGGGISFVPKLLEYLNRECIVSLEQAAKEIRAPSEEIAAYAQTNPGKLVYLAGPPAVLFRVAGTTEEATSG